MINNAYTYKVQEPEGLSYKLIIEEWMEGYHPRQFVTNAFWQWSLFLAFLDEFEYIKTNQHTPQSKVPFETWNQRLAFRL